MKQIVGLVFTWILLLPGASLADGKASYMLCLACHGPDGAGNVALNSPAIASQESWYLETQLKNFKSGIRGTHKIVGHNDLFEHGLTDIELDFLARLPD